MNSRMILIIFQYDSDMKRTSSFIIQKQKVELQTNYFE